MLIHAHSYSLAATHTVITGTVIKEDVQIKGKD